MTSQADVNLIRIYLACGVRDGDFSTALLMQFEKEADAWERRNHTKKQAPKLAST